MIKISLIKFKSLTSKYPARLTKLINNKLPVIIGRLAVNFFTESFRTESWGRTKWKEVKRKQSWTREFKYLSKHHPARTQHKILTGNTGDLGRSLQYKKEAGKVTVYSDLVYAAVHNFGLRAGRGKGFKMPKRQFIGDDEHLDKIIKDEIIKEINKILK